MGRRWLLVVFAAVCTAVLMAMMLQVISRKAALILVAVCFLAALPFAAAWSDK
jgi:hypothetical protein